MKKTIKISVIILSALIVLVLSGLLLIRWQFSRSVDDPNGTIHLPGISGTITIRRDKLGVPFINADNWDDLAFGTGYVTASDRLWQMMMMKMIMQGRLSEIAGKDALSQDILMRTLPTRPFVRDTLKGFSGENLHLLQRYSDGINAYLETHSALPPEFFLSRYRPEKWTPRDTMYVFAFLNLNLSFNFIEELDFINIAARVGYHKAGWLFPTYPDEPLPFTEAEKLKEIQHDRLNLWASGWEKIRKSINHYLPMTVPASNNWALAGSRTLSGKPIIANDTHLALTMPNAWMIIHQKCPGFEAAGVTPPGIPVVTLGYNGKVAWGATMVMADSQDIFVEKLKVRDGKTYYLYKGKWRAASERTERFIIRGEKPVVRRVRSTIHGPLLSDALRVMPFPPIMPVQPMPVESEYGLALSWEIGDGAKSMEAVVDLARAKSAAELRKTIMKIDSLYLNFMFGDSKNIEWQVSGLFPVRKKGTGQLPSPGWTGDYDWRGYMPAAGKPHKLNPPDGYIVTANNRTVGKNYPYQLTSSWYTPERAERLRTLLSNTDKATGETCSRYQFDHYSLFASRIQKLLFTSSLSQEITHEIQKMGKERAGMANEALAFLNPKQFNAVMDKNSPSAAVMGAFIYSVVRDTFLDELGPEMSVPWQSFMTLSIMTYSAPQDHLLYRDTSPFWDNIHTPHVETKAEIIAQALTQATEFCIQKMGKDRTQWKWGILHTYYWKNEITTKLPFFRGYFNRGPYPAGGDGHTVNVASPMWGKDFNVHVVPAMRLIVDFGKPEPARLLLTHGQSGNPASPHYDDMLPLYLRGKTWPLPFTEKGIAKQYRNILKLEPEK